MLKKIFELDNWISIVKKWYWFKQEADLWQIHTKEIFIDWYAIYETLNIMTFISSA